MTVQAWLRPTAIDAALQGLREGRTVVGGGAALASESFPPLLGPTALDLGRLGLDRRDGSTIGAMVTLEDLLVDARFVASWPGLAAAIRAIATPEVRRVATVGGSIAARLPTSDLAPALCAHHAVVELADLSGAHRRLPVADYLAEPLEGLVLGVDVGAPRRGTFRRFAGRAGFAPALASVAGAVHEHGTELWAGAVGPVPVLLPSPGLPPEHALREDEFASAWYRHRLLATLARDAAADLEEGP